MSQSFKKYDASPRANSDTFHRIIMSHESKPVAEAFCYTAVPNESESGRKLLAEPLLATQMKMKVEVLEGL